ncbi:MAG: DUF4272 domain-containing protein [Burkholderiales bacterium]|nr:DUF4272 domain-containing protein [Burkholderiales bacterium]
MRHFSNEEKGFIRDPDPSPAARNCFLWRYEAAWTLFWALGYVQALGIPRRACDVEFAVSCKRDRNTDKFAAESALRPIHQILDQADLIFRYHWAGVDAALAKRAVPAGLNGGIVYERHHALRWLIGYQDWDDVAIDIENSVG